MLGHIESNFANLDFQAWEFEIPFSLIPKKFCKCSIQMILNLGFPTIGNQNHQGACENAYSQAPLPGRICMVARFRINK